MQVEEVTLLQAVNRIRQELLKDKSEGSYYHGWATNISMAFWDELKSTMEKENFKIDWPSSFTCSEMCNRAAARFLYLLVFDITTSEGAITSPIKTP